MSSYKITCPLQRRNPLLPQPGNFENFHMQHLGLIYFVGSPHGLLTSPSAILSLKDCHLFTRASQDGKFPAPMQRKPPPQVLQRALGVDYGRRQIGLAVSTLGLAPRPLPFLPARGQDTVLMTAQSVVQTALAEREQRCHAFVCPVVPTAI